MVPRPWVIRRTVARQLRAEQCSPYTIAIAVNFGITQWNRGKGGLSLVQAIQAALQKGRQLQQAQGAHP